jgi:hypothetical protein
MIGSSVPIALFWGGKDTLLDMDALLERLSAPPVFSLEVKEYEHLHFLWGAGILNHVYPHILQLLRENGESMDGPVPSGFVPKKLDDKVYQLAKGKCVKPGDTVFPTDLCWGIDDGLSLHP